MKKNYFFALLAGLAAVLPATAAGTDDGYRPMIRQDRTWEYLQIHRDLSGTTDYALFRMKFDGSEVKNGKEYSRFVYCGDRSSWTSTIDYSTGTRVSTDTVTVPNDNATVYYLREEPGKVFILFPHDDVWGYDGKNYDVKKGDEVLLYDFTLKDGESFTGFWSSGDFAGGLVDYPVRALDPVKVAGEECRVFGMTKDFHGACDGYRFAEEAGCLDFGTLAAPDAVLRTTGLTTTDTHLQKMYDADGNVIYDAKDAPSSDIVDGNKSWNYNYLNIEPFSTYNSLTPGATYSFGEAETIDGIEYRPLLCNGKRTGMLMRQEGPKVYVRFEKDDEFYVYGYPAGEDYKDQDLLVYDLSAAVGDTFHALTEGEAYSHEWVELRVTDAGTLETLSGVRNFIKVVRNDTQDRREDTIVDGIGSISGIFFTADLGPQLSGDGYDKEILYEVTGRDDEVIYKGNGFTIGRDMVAEDRVWEYYYSDGSQSHNPERELYRWKFSGTEDKDGKSWNRLVSAGSVKWRGSDPETAVTDNNETVVALLRQEGDKVWILEDKGERVLYDFNLQPRDEANLAPNYDDLDYYTLKNITYKYCDLGVSGFYNFTPSAFSDAKAPIVYSSMWGNVGRGDMLNLEFEEEKDGAPVRCLRNVYGLDGKVLYKGADIKVPDFAGIDSMEAEDEGAPVYDILGRRVSTMVHGGIYIRDGKKFVNLGQH